ncbi:MAG: RidA family protein [Alphaproteobacteria bacterium]|jgi:enamine deaminase RidA (YjgF/YER057c/UK114 family)|nr:RidA family protein [Rhodospirillales bacterium]MDP6588505.1 RidA family protein [Alphaproteobacteria bacterium]MDP6819100.1 RidA family protein [Alphaproteobacteria bacterium]|tara:strand:+ start:1164 stop:1553 length:390 start_codon:yes stop_codon:yes gene_type:complete
MHIFHNPQQIAGPFGHYEHGVETALPGRLLHVSGQTGVAADGAVPEGFAAQTELVWRNIRAVLAAAGMTPQDIVKTNSYILDRDDVPVLAEMRKRYLGEDHRAASTTLVVSGLVRPEWLVEIDAIALAR